MVTCSYIGISLFTEGVFREVYKYKLRTCRVVLPCCTSMSIQHGARKKNGMQEHTPVPGVRFQVPCEIWVCKCWTHPPKKEASPFQALFRRVSIIWFVWWMNFVFRNAVLFFWRGVWLAQQPRLDLMCFLVGKKPTEALPCQVPFGKRFANIIEAATEVGYLCDTQCRWCCCFDLSNPSPKCFPVRNNGKQGNVVRGRLITSTSSSSSSRHGGGGGWR